MDELISKRAVIEAIEKARANVGHNLERSIGKSIIEILDDVGRNVDRLPSALSTNLAEVGTDCISRQQAIDALEKWLHGLFGITEADGTATIFKTIKQLPPIQPDKDKVNNLLYHIYSIQSPHLDMTGVIAKKYSCEELWKELFGKESELPGWMT